MRMYSFSTLWLFAVIATSWASEYHSIVKRQLSIDDIIHRALSLVRPIFDTSQPLQDDSMINRQLADPMVSEGMRQQSVLGTRPHSIVDDIPLCKGNSRICQFISCQAENFKKDENFANLNLAAQVLGDKKLRKAVSSNPEAINAVCVEQGLTDSQCKIFSKGFQIVDKFITTVEGDEPQQTHEKENSDDGSESQPTQEADTRRADPSHSPLLQDDSPMDEPPVPIGRSPHRQFGSKTWSAQANTITDNELQPIEPVQGMFPPSPAFPLSPLGLAGHFIHPTVPTAPPLAFPTFPPLPTLPPLNFPGILAIQPLKVPGLTIEKPIIQFSKDEYAYAFKQNSNDFLRKVREVDEDVVDIESESVRRVKRDYYDDLSQARRNLGFGKPVARLEAAHAGSSGSTNSDDYYSQTAEDSASYNSHKPKTAARDCLALLG